MRERWVKGFKRAARGAIEQGKGHDRRCDDTAVPRHNKFDADLLERDAERTTRAEQQQEEIAHDRGRQHKRQREHYIKYAFQ